MKMPETVNPWSTRQPSPSTSRTQACNQDGLSPQDVRLSEQRTLEFDGGGTNDHHAASSHERMNNVNPISLEQRDQNDHAKESKCCQRLKTCCLGMCKPCLAEYHPLSQEPSKCERLRHMFMCPPHGQLSKWLTVVLLVVLTWAVLWAVTGSEALPGGNLFALYILVVACKVGGALIKLIKLPPLLG